MAGLLDPMKGDGSYVENRPSKWAQTWGILEPYVMAPVNAWTNLMDADPYTLMTDTGPAAQNLAGDAFDVAGTAMGAGSVVPKPSNAVGMAMIRGTFPGSKMPSVDALARANAKGRFVYHSGVADNVEDMKYGVEPQVGPWVREIAEGEVDNIDEVIENSTPLAWWSKQPNWVKIKVARKLGKYVGDISEEDIRQHGHLAILPKKEPDAENLFWVGEDGLNNGPYSNVEDITGKKVNAASAGLYDNGDPMGVERNEYVSTRSVEPYLQLTGPELVEFLKKSGFLNYGIAGLLGGGAALNSMQGEPQKGYQ